MINFQQSPAFKFSIFLITGIIIGSKSIFGLSFLFAVIIFLLVAGIILVKTIQTNFSINFLPCFLVLFFGMLKAELDFNVHPDNSIMYFQNSTENSISKINAVVLEFPDSDSTKIRFKSEIKKVISDNDTIDVTGIVIVTVRKNFYSKKNNGRVSIEPGDEILLSGKLSEPPAARNPGEFDYKSYLLNHGIYKIFSAYGFEKIKIISKDNLGFFNQSILFPLKKFVFSNIDENLNGDEAAFLKGLLTGDRSSISPEMKEAFVNSGVMHLIAVSGLNVTYMIISLTMIFSLIRIRVILKTFIIIFFLIFYCIFTESPASIQRATVMGVLVLISILMERKINFYNILGAASAFILICDSRLLFDPGFILSFAATLSMVFIYSIFENLFLKNDTPVYKKNKLMHGISVLFLTTLAAQIGTLPLTAIYFEKISMVSIAANLIAVPLANLSLAIGFMQIFAASFSQLISEAIAETNNLLLHFQITFIKWCASFDFSYLRTSSFSLCAAVIYYLTLICLMTAKQFKQFIFRIIICFCAVAGIIIYDFETDKNLKLTILDVGQGDCSVIKTPDGKIIVIDCGLISEFSNSGERTVIPFLRRNGIEKIDLLILTHLHLDHIGGIKFILENMKVGKIADSGQLYKSKFVEAMDSLINVRNIPREKIRAGDYIDGFENLRMYFLFPSENFVDVSGKTKGENLNNGSVAFILKFKEVNLFFGGDIEEDAELFLCRTYDDFLKTGFLKVSHHGSSTSTTVPFISKNKPDYSVISCGIGNKFNHPSEIIIKRLEDCGSQIFRTDLEGAVVFETDGFELKKINWK